MFTSSFASTDLENCVTYSVHGYLLINKYNSIHQKQFTVSWN